MLGIVPKILIKEKSFMSNHIPGWMKARDLQILSTLSMLWPEVLEKFKDYCVKVNHKVVV